jgi:hypothetical protein
MQQGSGMAAIPYPANMRGSALRGAFRKGWEAFWAGRTLLSNPYPDKRTRYQNSVTFSRAFRRHWAEGWRAGEQEASRRIRAGA